MTSLCSARIRFIAIASLGLCVMPLYAADPVESQPAATQTPRRLKLPPIPATFKHPGLLHSLEELQSVKKHIEAGEEPWKSAFQTMKTSMWANPHYRPKPHEVCSSGFLGAGGAAGGAFDENNDAMAAYTQALMWIFTGDEEYAESAVGILNAWTMLKRHEGPNWYMMAEWEGAMFPEGAELIRATYPKWKKEDIAEFSDMLSRVFLPVLHNRFAFGNRQFGAINAQMAIGVFNDDRAAFCEGLAHWVSYVPSWIYLKEDGPAPIRPDYWLTTPTNEELDKLDEGLFPDVKQSWIYSEERVKAFMKENHLGDDITGMLKRYQADSYWCFAPPEAYVDGLCAETFRDLGHCEMGLGELINAAEIAWHQGIDLYSIHGKRITTCMELHTFLRIGDPVPKVFYGVQPSGMNPTFEIAYNHYHNRMGMDLPNTRRLIQQVFRGTCLNQKLIVTPGMSYVEPEPGLRTDHIGYPGGLAIAWETLTHAELGGVRAPPKK